MSKLRSRENTASKLRGAGDSVKVHGAPPGKSQERTPVPSSRKFTPTSVRNERLQLQLKKAIVEMQSPRKGATHPSTTMTRLKKSKSIAEITPTKTRPKKSRCDSGGLTTLHATPRPLATGDPASRRQEMKAGRLIYQRLVLFAWRRNRARLATLSESSRRHQDQIAQLELQVEVLKKLGKSECDKRNEAIAKYNNVSNRLEEIEMEKKTLIEDNVELENGINEAREIQRLTLIDFENVKNELNTRRSQVEILDKEIKKRKNELVCVGEERDRLYAKLNVQNSAILLQIEAIRELEDKLTSTENHVFNVELSKNEEQKKYNELLAEQQMEISKRVRLEDELKGLYAAKKDLEDKIENFRNKMDDLNSKLTALINENEGLRARLEKAQDEQKRWWLMATNTIKITWCVLRHSAYLMLPAF